MKSGNKCVVGIPVGMQGIIKTRAEKKKGGGGGGMKIPLIHKYACDLRRTSTLPRALKLRNQLLIIYKNQ